jgi:hypothetical protein
VVPKKLQDKGLPVSTRSPLGLETRWNMGQRPCLDHGGTAPRGRIKVPPVSLGHLA